MKKKLNKVLVSSALLATVAVTPVSSLTPVFAQGYNVVSDEAQEVLYASADENENVAKLNVMSKGYTNIYGYNENHLVVQNSDSYLYDVKAGYKMDYKMDNGQTKYFSQYINCLDSGIIAAVESEVAYEGIFYYDTNKKQKISIEFNYPEGLTKSTDERWALYNDKLHVYIVPCCADKKTRYCLFDEEGNYIETEASYTCVDHESYFNEMFNNKDQLIGRGSDGNYYVYDNNGERNLGITVKEYEADKLIYNGKLRLRKSVGGASEYYVLDVNTGEMSYITKIKSSSGNSGASSGYHPEMMGDSLVIKGKIYNSKGESYEKSGSIEATGEIKKYYFVKDYTNERNYYIDAQGNKYGMEYKTVGKFVNGKAIVLDNDNNAYVVDEDFNRVSSMISSVEDVATLSDGYYKVKIGGLYYGASFNEENVSYMITGSDGKKYWYENGVKQGTEGRGKEIYDPETDAWYWLDAVQDGAVATSKDVYQESNGGKWVRYDENGRMVKGWNVQNGKIYYFDPVTGAMAKGWVKIDGQNYYFDENTGIHVSMGFIKKDGKKYWYEGDEIQGREGRGKEIYDPETDAWYWLDAIQDGAVAVNKDVYQESYAGAFADREDGTGKWVRYDENGHMVKGWNEKDGNTYYFDLETGAMAKGTVEIEGQTYTFDWATGVLQK